ncbi:MAG: GumC family protein, partial [Bryobacteraceae bacterium]|nr:GumC family protein [Bryobacteraceae bacterium]
MNQAVQESSVIEVADEIDLRSLWETFSPWKWRILFLSLLAVALAMIVAKGITPLFPATTTLMVEAGQARPLKIEDVYGLETSGNEYFETQFAVVRSREIAQRVVQKLGLVNDEYFYTEKPGLVQQVRAMLPLPAAPVRLLDDSAKMAKATDRLVDSLKVEPVRKTQLVNIGIEHPDPKAAARITDAIANEYVESQMEIQLNIARNAAEWLGSRLTDLKQNLTKSETELQQFLEANNLVDLQGVQTVPAEELKELHKQVSDSRGKLNELSRRYGERHPQLLATREELSSLERAYAAKLREIQSIGRKEAQLRQLQRNVQVNRQLYDTFLQRAGETTQSNKWESPMARIIDRGVPALQPSQPRLGLIAAATFIATFLFATLLVF